MLSTAVHSRPQSPSFLGHVDFKRGAGSLQIKPSDSGDENDSGHDRGEGCLSAVFFALLTCWNVQFSKIFAFLFFYKNYLPFIGKIGLARKSRVHKTVTTQPR